MVCGSTYSTPLYITLLDKSQMNVTHYTKHYTLNSLAFDSLLQLDGAILKEGGWGWLEVGPQNHYRILICINRGPQVPCAELSKDAELYCDRFSESLQVKRRYSAHFFSS